MVNSSLSDHCREVILGSLLGDGSLKIHSPYKNARFSFRHSEKQKDYFFWKTKQLENISSDSCWWLQEADGLGGRKFRYQSRAIIPLTELYSLTHKGGRLKIHKKWLNLLTPQSLAIWWLDDGSLIGEGARRGVFCTEAFTYENQKVLTRYLKSKWGIKVKIAKITRIWKGQTLTYHRLRIQSGEELRKLLRIILPHMKVPAMLPKVLLLYKDPNLQQRWISEVSLLTGFSEKIIQQKLIEKKSRWKHFRE